MNIQIVEVKRENLQELQHISRTTFYQSFAEKNTKENMQFFLDHYYSDEKLLSEWMNGDSMFFFAKEGVRTVGYLKLNTGAAQTVLPNDQALEIERIYIDQSMQGRGIGKLFIEKTMAIASQLQLRAIWLGVWEHNTDAILFYEKNGFQAYDKHLFQLGDDAQTDLLMKKQVG
jgi:ribosomal protein S18 acetylase RimI-like enzyme